MVSTGTAKTPAPKKSTKSNLASSVSPHYKFENLKRDT